MTIMATILTGSLFKVRYMVGGRMLPALLIHAENMDEADQAVLLHAGDQPGYGGEEVRIVASTAIDTDAL
jgi:hypothetical protein